ncbi:TPA: hypothetical protein KOG79_002864 [Clostridioides difficile]|uniref:hypothetical protein n=1 Tax=Clostridioides difficile TaxID=1496 RepID=UPI0003B29C06|nr:hypothetical protein [Clostridioides difficile]MCR1707758.1 hypothetical protein [Clostridioides difficile]MDL5083302.1 hypothetical protein [Clostridioides difficile]CCL21986.1 conserved hypothetical protein [Clostridioides difficile T15]SJO65944.1 Uncharacterised protein [Clostridioides difficile]SJP10030.1 Uncharacterised protein [Clostridioides difficile]
MKDVWLYSWDDECFRSDEYESKEEAVEAAKEELKRLGEIKRWVYIGKKEEADIPDIDAKDALECIQNRIDDEYGEYVEDWFENIRAEDILILESRISEVFKKWIDDFKYKPYWFAVRDIEEIELKNVVN